MYGTVFVQQKADQHPGFELSPRLSLVCNIQHIAVHALLTSVR